MGLFGLVKNKRGGLSKKSPLDIINKDEITGSLYYLLYNIKSLRINVVGKDDDYACKISEIDDKKELFYLTVLGRASISKSDEVELKYDVAEIRYSFKTISKKNTTEYDLCLEYPAKIEHFERRKGPRVVFRKNENIDINLVTDLFSGYGAVARLNNLGNDGFNCAIRKIVKVSTGKDIQINPISFKPGTTLSIIKLKLPGYGEVEVSGETIHIKQAGFNLGCGGSFSKPRGRPKDLLEKFVSARSYSPLPPDYPGFYNKYLTEKNKPKEDDSKGKEKVAAHSNNERDYSKVTEEEAHQTKAAVEEEISLAREYIEPSEEELALEKQTKDEQDSQAIEIKEVPDRKESILLVIFDADEVTLIRSILKDKGFKNETLVNNYVEALKLMTEKTFDLVFLDFDLQGQVKADQFITTLKSHPTLRGLPIVIFLDSIDPAKQAKIISLRINRLSLRPIKKPDIIQSLDKILGE